MSGLSLQDVKTLFDVHNDQSKERHQELKQEMRNGFSKLGERVHILEQAEKPLITAKSVKWVTALAIGAVITTYIGGAFGSS